MDSHESCAKHSIASDVSIGQLVNRAMIKFKNNHNNVKRQRQYLMISGNHGHVESIYWVVNDYPTNQKSAAS